MRALSGPNREMLCKRGVMRELRMRDWETALGLQLVCSSSLLLRVLARETGILARGGCPAKISPRCARESSAFWPVELPSKKNRRASRERVCQSIANVLVRAG